MKKKVTEKDNEKKKGSIPKIFETLQSHVESFWYPSKTSVRKTIRDWKTDEMGHEEVN